MGIVKAFFAIKESNYRYSTLIILKSKTLMSITVTLNIIIVFILV